MKTYRMIRTICVYFLISMTAQYMIAQSVLDTPRTRYSFGEVELDTLCGPKPLLAVASLFARKATLDEFISMTHPDENGTTMYALSEAAKKFGFSVAAHKLKSVQELEERGKIAIVWANQRHFFVVERVVGN